FGNYISVPVLLAAHALHIPTMIHEQNSYAGKANKMLANVADAIVGCYEENMEQFPKNKTRILGNPRASEAAKITVNNQIMKDLGF
ncbi:MAG: glycosyltransferase, partial [Anaerorhabdus sp.]